jgi:hypothetical protein
MDFVLTVDDALPVLHTTLTKMIGAAKLLVEEELRATAAAGRSAGKKKKNNTDIIAAVACELASLPVSSIVELSAVTPAPAVAGTTAAAAAAMKRPRVGKKSSAAAAFAPGVMHAFLVVPSQVAADIVAAGSFTEYLSDACKATKAPYVTLLVVNTDGGRRRVGYLDAVAEIIAAHCAPPSQTAAVFSTRASPAGTPVSSQQPVAGGIKRTFLFGSSSQQVGGGSQPMAGSVGEPLLGKITETAQLPSLVATAAHILHAVRYLVSPNNQKKRGAQIAALDEGITSKIGKKGRKCESSDFHTLYKNMLEEISGCSARQASLLATVFPTMRSLLEAAGAANTEGFLAKAAGVLDISDRVNGKGKAVGLGVARVVERALKCPIGGDAAQLAELNARAGQVFGGCARLREHRQLAATRSQVVTGSKATAAGADDEDDDEEEDEEDEDEEEDFLAFLGPSPAGGSTAAPSAKGPSFSATPAISSIMDDLQRSCRLSTA